MIVIQKDRHGVTITGHAGYEEPGKDIVCAAVSVLVQTLAASAKQLPLIYLNFRFSIAPYEESEEYEAWLEEGNRKPHERMQGVEQTPLAELQRRRIGSQGQEIIDKPTYNKLTKDFLRHGGIIIRGKDAEKHLKKQGAYASYMTGGNFAFIRDDATVSDVLGEMYHAEQDRKNLFSEYPDNEVLVRREIDAQHYLISVAKKYKIPLEEIEVTRKNLAEYEDQLSQIVSRETWEK